MIAKKTNAKKTGWLYMPNLESDQKMIFFNPREVSFYLATVMAGKPTSLFKGSVS